MKEYKTIEKESFDEFVEKKSRFIGYACPVATVDEAKGFISKIKTKHFDATHNVSAYVLKDGFKQKYNDDGEPSGTAGFPALDVLLKENLVDVCVVVTRYFGGTLLGAGGLVRAYSHSSKIAVQSANIITMAHCYLLNIKVDYSFFDRLNIILNDFGANVDSTEFEQMISVNFSIKEELVSMLNEKINEHSFGKYNATKIGEKYAKV